MFSVGERSFFGADFEINFHNLLHAQEQPVYEPLKGEQNKKYYRTPLNLLLQQINIFLTITPLPERKICFLEKFKMNTDFNFEKENACLILINSDFKKKKTKKKKKKNRKNIV